MAKQTLKDLTAAFLTGIFLMVIAGGVAHSIGMFERPWLTFKALPHVALNADGSSPRQGTLAQVKAGEVLPTFVYRCSHADAVRSYTVTRFLECKHHEPLPIEPNLAYLPMGCTSVIGRRNVIPAGTLPDVCRFVGSAELQGKVKSFQVPFSTDWFEVVP